MMAGNAGLADACTRAPPTGLTALAIFAPKFSAVFQLNDRTSLFANLARGFRAPQMTELYRLQSGQQVSDLDSERIDSLEVGLRQQRENWSSDLVIYSMRKRDSVFRDAEGFNITGARSRHRGIEAALDWHIKPRWQLSFDATYALHTYDFNAAGRGEIFVKGRDIDTAPKFLGSAELKFDPSDRFSIGVQWLKLGKYYLDAENRFSYPGHSLANLRASLKVSPRLGLVLRVNNITDRLIADRADYAFGNHRYFPGRGRELFAEIRYLLSVSQ